MIDYIRNAAVEYVPKIVNSYPTRPCGVGSTIRVGSTSTWLCLDQNMKFRAERYHGCYGGWFRVICTWDRYLGITALQNLSTVAGLNSWNALAINFRSACNRNGLLTFNLANNTVTTSRSGVRLTITEITIQ